MNYFDTFTKILGKIIVATGFEWLPKVQKIAQSGHTGDIRHVHAFYRTVASCRSGHDRTLKTAFTTSSRRRRCRQKSNSSQIFRRIRMDPINVEVRSCFDGQSLCQCDQMGRLFFPIWPFTTIKTYAIA